MNYHNKTFQSIQNSESSEVSSDTLFHYQQIGNILTCTYSGSRIISGHLIGLVSEEGIIDMRYHQVNNQGQLMTGICTSTPEMREDGRIRLYEKWQWTSGDMSKGESVLEES